MSNTNILIERLAKTSLALLKNELVVGRLATRDYENEFVNPGDTVSVRRPVDFTVRTGETASIQDINRGKIQVKIDTVKGVDLQFGGKELALEVPEMIRALDLDNAMARVAQAVDADLFAELYQNTWNWVGTPGTTIASYTAFLKGTQRMTEMSVPLNNRSSVLSPADYTGLIGSNAGLYAQQEAANAALRKAQVGILGGADTYQTAMVPTHTTGARGGTPLINGVNIGVVAYATVKDTNQSTLTIDGCSNSITGWAKKGDVLTIANVLAVNPATKAAMTYAQQFVVQADANSDGSGNLTLVVSPAIITSGAYQTVNSAPADNAAITMAGSAATGYLQNMMFQRGAITMASRPMAKIDAQYEAYATDEDLGLSLKVTRDGDILNNKSITRIDFLYGKKAIRPDLATRQAG
jgi:hypothetical protein